MSDNGGFLARWSRRKRSAVPAPRAAAPPPGSDIPPPAAPPVDPASLPPIESIGPETDVRAFLAAGVPPNLTRAALRRAWTSDPAIRDFIGLSENSWDFNAPGAMAGFGSITREEVARLLNQALGETPSEPAPAPSSVPTPAPPTPPAPAGQQAAATEIPASPAEKNNRDGAAQHETIARRPTHGGALPE